MILIKWCGHDCNWNAIAHFGQSHGKRQPWLDSTAAWELLYLDYSKCSLHKSVFCAMIFVDYTVKYQSKINKSHPRVRPTLD